jgi:hypothetical protein
MDPRRTSASKLDGSVPGTFGVNVVRGVLARIQRAIEAASDGDSVFAESILDDLAADLWRLIERAERNA